MDKKTQTTNSDQISFVCRGDLQNYHWKYFLTNCALRKKRNPYTPLPQQWPFWYSRRPKFGRTYCLSYSGNDQTSFVIQGLARIKRSFPTQSFTGNMWINTRFIRDKSVPFSCPLEQAATSIVAVLGEGGMWQLWPTMCNWKGPLYKTLISLANIAGAQGTCEKSLFAVV